jgi:hypothetical protein
LEAMLDDKSIAKGFFNMDDEGFLQGLRLAA